MRTALVQSIAALALKGMIEDGLVEVSKLVVSNTDAMRLLEYYISVIMDDYSDNESKAIAEVEELYRSSNVVH